MIEKYLNGEISEATVHRETSMLNISLQEEYNKLIPKIETIAARR